MTEYISEADIEAGVQRLTPVLSTKFCHDFLGGEHWQKLEKIVRRRLSPVELVRLIVRKEGPALLSRRVERIGKGRTSVREKLLESLPEEAVRRLYVELRHSDPPAQLGRVVSDLATFKWQRGSSSALRITRTLGLPESFAGVQERGRRERLFEVEPHSHVSPLLPFQAGVLSKLDECLGVNGRAMVSSFTGTGKTRMGMEHVISRLLDNGEEPALVIWVAQKAELLDQASDTIEELWPWRADKTGQSLSIYRYLEGEEFDPIELNHRPGFVIATSLQLIARIKQSDPFLMEALRRAQLVVIDEAHFSLARGHQDIVAAYAAARGRERARVLGLTATPGRSNLGDVDESRRLAQLFDSRLIVPTISAQPLTLAWFQEQRILARIEHRVIDAPSQILQTLGKRKISAETHEGQREFTQEFLEVVGRDTTRNSFILLELIRLHGLGRHILVFCCNIEQTNLLFEGLLVSGVPAGLVHHEIDRRDRRGTIQKFRKGEIHVLLNVEVLTTGFDAPKIDTLVMCRPTLSAILYEQMVGRGLRGPMMGGTETCEIVDFTDNLGMFAEPQAYGRFWQDWDPNSEMFQRELWPNWQVVSAEPEAVRDDQAAASG
jgi:DNA repair protein RadD